MLIDAFTYNGEDDILSVRLELLASFVDYFVIVEADKTFTGIPKDKKFNLDKFKKYSHKIKYFYIDTLEENPASPWINEYKQRNSLISGLADLKDDDLFILSDVDEIPSPQAILDFDPNKYLLGEFEQKLFFYGFNYQAHNQNEQPVHWLKAKIITYGNFKRYFATLEDLRSSKQYGFFRAIKKYHLRKNKRILQNGGWHFT
jgi:beta-1,4-mannosyl-glycoprotein beta-1,4-N-acetylglucosaminyltransferase